MNVHFKNGLSAESDEHQNLVHVIGAHKLKNILSMEPFAIFVF